MQSLLSGGWIRVDTRGLGIDVDTEVQVISRAGESTRGQCYRGPWLRAHAARAAGRLVLSEETKLPAPS